MRAGMACRGRPEGKVLLRLAEWKSAALVRIAWNAGARDVSSLGRAFDASEQAMEIRLRELRLSS